MSESEQKSAPNGPTAQAVGVAGGARPKPGSARSIQACNFRSAGRLSNENARSLTTVHEQFARNVTNTLDGFLGTSVELRLVSLEQIDFPAYLAGLGSTEHVVPCTFAPIQGSFLLQMDVAFMFPIIDLLLGGLGTLIEGAHELTEIDEEILRSVTAVIARELERAWLPLTLAVVPGATAKHSMLRQIFPANEKPLLLTFSATVVGSQGVFRMVLPTSFASILLRQLRIDPSRRRKAPKLNLSEWILDCDVTTSAALRQVRVRVSELVALKPGSVLKLSAPVQSPARYTVEDREMFEALPVRSGLHRAAQLLSELPAEKWATD